MIYNAFTQKDRRYVWSGNVKIEDIIEQLDRIERMLFTLLNETDKDKFKNEKIEKYKFQLTLYEKLLKEEDK